jgi:hypothetical protein
VCALDGFHVEIECARAGVCSDCSIPGIGKGTGLSITETCDIVFISTEILVLGGSRSNVRVWGECGVKARDLLKFEGAELLVDDLPYDLIRRHVCCSASKWKKLLHENSIRECESGVRCDFAHSQVLISKKLSGSGFSRTTEKRSKPILSMVLRLTGNWIQGRIGR